MGTSESLLWMDICGEMLKTKLLWSKHPQLRSIAKSNQDGRCAVIIEK
jgi:hypothetical protein